MSPASNEPKCYISTLYGKRIVITAHELESVEHRGISAFTKSLIKVLSDNGCEVWLLTEFFPSKQSGNFKNINSNFIDLSYLLDFLARGYSFEKNLQTKFFKFIPFIKTIAKWSMHIKHYILCVRFRVYPRRKLLYINNKQYHSPYLKLHRLTYLNNIKGFICARRIYYSSKIKSKLGFNSPIKIDLKGFDAFISTSPLNIRPLNVDTYIQSIHDLIPLEYEPNPFQEKIFKTKLLESLNSKRIFISNTTKKKFKEVITLNTKEDSTKVNESIVLQVPTLDIDKDKNYNYYFQNNFTNKYGLKPLKYILFNASIDTRKNLFFLIESYIDSNIHEKDIKLVIVGMFNHNIESEKSLSLINELNSRYCVKTDEMKEEDKELQKALSDRDFSLASKIHMQYKNNIQHQNRIITTGYVDDEEKTILYLNSLAMVNPSLIEGLGLPVLDSACLGLKSIVSDCDSHKEISCLYDFSDYLILKNILCKQDWINSLISLAEESLNSSIYEDNIQLHAMSKTIKSRIDRYLSFKEIISNNCMKSISSLFNTQ